MRAGFAWPAPLITRLRAVNYDVLQPVMGLGTRLPAGPVRWFPLIMVAQKDNGPMHGPTHGTMNGTMNRTKNGTVHGPMTR